MAHLAAQGLTSRAAADRLLLSQHGLQQRLVTLGLQVRAAEMAVVVHYHRWSVHAAICLVPDSYPL